MKKPAKKSAKAKRATRRRAVSLPDDACPTCGAVTQEKTGPLSHPINGEEVVVPKVSHLACPKCGEVMLRPDEVRFLREEALASYRAKHGLLSSAEIRALRERLDLTQEAMARLLHLGSNTLSRWEAGRNVQTAAMDLLLRMLRDLPGSLDYLRRHAA